MTDSRPCPICDARKTRRLMHQSFEALPMSLINGYDVVVCQACGMAYASGLPSPEQFDRYYAAMSKYEDATASYYSTPEDQARRAWIGDMVADIAPDRSISILDVGCSTGELLATFKERGYTSLEGIDPSPVCADLARRKHGTLVRPGTVSDLNGLARCYDLITFSHVMEHLLDPLRALRDTRLALNDGGLVFIEVPDVEGFAECALAPFQEFSVEHINYFSRMSLTGLAAETGFEPIMVRRRQVPWTSGSHAAYADAVFRKVPQTTPRVRDSVSEPALVAYVARCERIEDDVRKKIQGLAARNEPVLVWGVGTHTRHLLESGALEGLQVAAWVDSDPKLHGTHMRDLPVIGPEEVRSRTEPILISSGTVHHEISSQIHGDLGLTNEVLLLYD